MNSQRPITLFELLRQRRRDRSKRTGVVVVMTGFCLIAVFAFVALSVDASRMVLTETKMQNACDAASLAAAQEITAAVYAAGQGQGSANIDANSIAVTQAKAMAQQVAAANGVYVNPGVDVKFGKRTYNAGTNTWPIAWNATPYNVVQVVARRTGGDVSAPDGQLPLAFGWAVGRSKAPITTSATAFVEARDLVIVIDFSGSMNYDSNMVESNLSQSAVNACLDEMWTAMRNGDPKWPGTSTSKFPSTGFGSINSAAGTYVSSTNTSTILSTLGLTTNQSGNRKFPYPQAGRNTDGSPKNKPSNTNSDALWTNYINFVKNHPNSSLNKRYGYRSLMDFMQQKTQSNGYTPRDRYASEDMWRTPHQPMNAVKNGATLFLDFLTDLDFGDEVGLVGYGQWAEQITGLSDGVVSINISDDPITPEYNLIDDLQRHHQAGEFSGQTAIGDGILKAQEMLVGDGSSDGFSRYGARPTMLLMTDGQSNQKPSGWTLPSGFNWSEYTDYDGNGSADYSTSDNYKRHTFYQAVQAAQHGITIHTLAVGAEADVELMKAIAFMGGGICIVVPGGTSVAQMQSELLEAFGQIASKVPPGKLVYEATGN